MPLRRADDTSYLLASGASATGSAVAVRGGEYMFMVDGTLAGATVALQYQMPNGTWAPVSIFSGSLVQFTIIPGAQAAIDLPSGNVRMGVFGGSPSGLTAYLVGTG